MVDFDEPWCDHETMEESGWLDVIKRQREAAVARVIDDAVWRAALELHIGARDAVIKIMRDAGMTQEEIDKLCHEVANTKIKYL